MPGPLPKDPTVRQRRNRASTAATLAAPAATVRALTPRDDALPWHPAAVEAWDLAWASPMAKEYTDADVPGLRLMADLTHRYWHDPSTKTAAELRQQRALYGLDPLSRRRLGWKLDPAVAPAAPIAAPVAQRDPRLRAVS